MNQSAICVYCASSTKVPKIYFDAAYKLGNLIAERGLAAVSGGGRAGLMGTLIDGVLDAGGQAIGILPQFMIDNGWQHDRLSEMIVTTSMHERKQRMALLSQAVIALPGGVGTFDELFEIVTWRQLGLYKGNIVIANIDGYYDLLLAHLKRSIEQGFMRGDHAKLWQVAQSPEEALAMALSSQNTSFSAKY